MRRARSLAPTLVSALLLAWLALQPVVAPVAQAAFPGENGKIAFTRQHADGSTDVYTVNPDGTGLKQLTTAPGDDEQPAVSADGSKIAFASDRSGDWAVYTMDADGSNVQAVSNITNDFDWEPAWSPDGDKIAWTHEGGGDHGVWIRYLDSGIGFELLSTAWSPDWSPDGTRLAMVSFRDGDASAEIYTITPTGSGLQQLTDNDRPEDGVDWAPDGSRLVYHQFDFDGSDQVNNELWLVDPDGTNEQLLWDQGEASDPTYSPDGTKIAYTLDGDIVWGYATVGAPNTIVGGSTIDYDPDWGPIPQETAGGELIAFTSTRDGNPEIYVMAPDGSEQTRLTFDGAIDDYPAISPDGERIAFTSWRDGDAEIYAMDVDGSNLTKLTDNGGYDAEPTWSPSGVLMFVSDRDGAGTDLWYLYGGVPFGPYGYVDANNFSPDWSANGVVMVSDQDGGNELYTFIPDGTVTVPLTASAQSDYAPDWAPEAPGAVFHNVMFVRGAPGDGDLYQLSFRQIPAPGDPVPEAYQVTDTARWEFSPTWRGDATWIAFSRAQPGDIASSEIWAMGMEGTERQVTDTVGANYNPDWGPCTLDAEGLCAAVTAAGHARTITLKLDDHLTASGKVKSLDGTPACVDRVPVKIQRKTQHGWKGVRSTTTDAQGRYEQGLPDDAGKYRARAKRIVVGGEVCLRATSDTVRHGN